MKKMLIFVAIVTLVAGSLIAEESVLIDFTKLAAAEGEQNAATEKDFSNSRFGSSLPESTRQALVSSLAIENWEIKLTSSARTVDNMVRSRIKQTDSSRGAVMGVRIHFPVERIHSSALVVPPFEIPAYDPRFQDELGVLTNVGDIKSIEVNYYSLNFPHELSIILIDSDGKRRNIRMGYMNQTYEGWGKLIWNNPAYVQDARNRNLALVPLYPDFAPIIRFGGFEIRRDAMHPGGDFITYFQDVKIVYDKAVLDDADRDIDNEAVWSILEERDEARRIRELERYGQNQVMLHIEREKQTREPAFDDPSRREQ